MARILYLDHATALGGAERSLLDLLRKLDRAAWDPILACPPGALAEAARALGIEVADLELGKLKDKNPFRSLRRLRSGVEALARVADQTDCQIVHANTLRTAAYAAAARGGRWRLLWHVRDYQMPRWARFGLMRRCDLAVAPSRFVAESLPARSKVRVVPNGLDLPPLPGEDARLAFRAEFGIAAEAPVVGCLGRVRPWKGQRHFIELAATLAPRLPEAVFLVVGGTLFPDPGRDYLAELKDYAAQLDVADRVVFTGHREDALVALAAMDVVVNCSRDEPFGRVLLEAMACRRPVVAFRSGAVEEIVEDGSTGLLVPLGDVAGMAEAVYDLVRNRERAEAYGEAGRQRVATNFTLDATVRAIEEIYRQLL